MNESAFVVEAVKKVCPPVSYAITHHSCTIQHVIYHKIAKLAQILSQLTWAI